MLRKEVIKMDKTKTNERTGGPPIFDGTDFVTWKNFFVAFLRGCGSAHKCLDRQRPDISEGTYFEEYSNLCEQDEEGTVIPGEEANAYFKKVANSARKWDKRNDKAIANIYSAVNNSTNAIAKQVLMDASTDTSAMVLLKLLEDRFNLKDIKVIQNELKNFNGLHILPNETAESFVNRIQVTATKLKNLGRPVNEDIEMLARLKEGLIIDARYKDLAQAIKVASDMNWKKAVNHVIAEDLNLAVKYIEDPSIKPDKVNMVRVKNQRKRSSNNSHLSGVRCNICNKVGHLAANCYRNRDRKSYATQKFQNSKGHPNKRKCYLCDSSDHVIKDCPRKQEFKDYKRSRNDENDNYKRTREDKGSRGFDGFFTNERVNMVKTSAFKPGSKKKAAIDSGATSHLLPEEAVAHFTRSQSRAQATNFREVSIPVGTAKSGSHIHAIGRVDIGRIQNAIVVEEGVIEKPLISVSKLDKAGYETTFKNGMSTVRDPEGNVVLEAPLEDDLNSMSVS